MRGLTALMTLVLLVGCETPQVEPIRVEDIAGASVLAFIKDGATTREQVLLRLGTPSAQFEGERILTYQLRANNQEEITVFWPRRSDIHPILTHWQRDIFSLVLVFDDAGMLKAHSVVGAK